MRDLINNEEVRRQYLLGLLPSSEREQLEDAYLTDDALFEQMEVAESELVNAYVRDELSPFERAKFKEKLLASPRLLENAKFAQALADSLSHRERNSAARAATQRKVRLPQSREPFLKRILSRWFFVDTRFSRVVFGTPAVVMLVLMVPLLFEWRHLRVESERIAAERSTLEKEKQRLEQTARSDRSEVERLAAENNQLRAQNEKLLLHPGGEAEQAQPLIPTFALINLIPGISTRGGEQQEVKISSNANSVRFKLHLSSNDYPRYDVTITDTAGTIVGRGARLQPHQGGRGSFLIFDLRKKRGSGDYHVRVVATGQSLAVEDYQFRLSSNK